MNGIKITMYGLILRYNGLHDNQYAEMKFMMHMSIVRIARHCAVCVMRHMHEY